MMLLLAVAVMRRANIPAIAPAGLRRQRGRARDVTALEVHIDTALVLLRRVLQPQLPADLLDTGFDLLDVVGRVVTSADDDVQMGLAARLGVAYPRLEDVLGLLDELPVQVDRVLGDAALGVVLAEDVLGRLLVVLVHLGPVALALVAQLLRLGAIAALVRLAGLYDPQGSQQVTVRLGFQLL